MPAIGRCSNGGRQAQTQSVSIGRCEVTPVTAAIELDVIYGDDRDGYDVSKLSDKMTA